MSKGEVMEKRTDGKREIICPRGCPYRSPEKADVDLNLCSHPKCKHSHCGGWWDFPEECPLESAL